MITAKIRVTHKTVTGEAEDRQAAVTFFADYEDGRNKEWSRYTPSLSLSMTVKDSLVDRFEVGKQYTLTFEEEDGAPDPAEESTQDSDEESPA